MPNRRRNKNGGRLHKSKKCTPTILIIVDWTRIPISGFYSITSLFILMNRTAARLISRLSVNFAVRGQHYRCSAGLYRSLSAFTTSSRNDTAKPVILVNTCSSSNVSTNREPAMNEDLDASKLTTVQKFKLMWKKYGILTVITYFGLYGCTLTAMFLALEADVLSASSFGLDSTTVISSVSRACRVLIVIKSD